MVPAPERGILYRHRTSRGLGHKTIHVLDIPDEYQFMDPKLVEQLQGSMSVILGLK